MHCRRLPRSARALVRGLVISIPAPVYWSAWLNNICFCRMLHITQQIFSDEKSLIEERYDSKLSNPIRHTSGFISRHKRIPQAILFDWQSQNSQKENHKAIQFTIVLADERQLLFECWAKKPIPVNRGSTGYQFNSTWCNIFVMRHQKWRR